MSDSGLLTFQHLHSDWSLRWFQCHLCFMFHVSHLATCARVHRLISFAISNIFFFFPDYAHFLSHFLCFFLPVSYFQLRFSVRCLRSLWFSFFWFIRQLIGDSVHLAFRMNFALLFSGVFASSVVIPFTWLLEWPSLFSVITTCSRSATCCCRSRFFFQ